MNVDHTSAIPLYKQIENYLRKLIESGEYNGGKFLPKEKDLANQFGVSRNTVRQGISKLVQEGLVKRTQGKGTVVINSNISTQLDEWHSFSEEMMKKGVKLQDYSINIDWVTADSKLAEILQVEEKTLLLQLERLRGDNDGPFVYFISWFHPRLELTGEEDFSRRLYEVFEKDLSIFPSRSEETLKAINPNSEIAKQLNIKKKEPILFRQRKVYDAGDRIIEYNEGHYRGDKFSYCIDIKRDFKNV